MSKKNKLQFIIKNVININEKYQEIKKIKGENFNIFSILKLERNEVKTHSNFIFELLNYKGSHNQDNVFLKIFIEKVLKLNDYGSIEKVKVHQEYLTIKHRRIDFVIETEIYQIGIEMKIDAKDQDMQLLDYMTELKRANKIEKLYYLTLNGREASEKSIGHKKINYLKISFENDIYDWITTCIEKSATIPLLREGLIHYKNLITIITNKLSKPMEIEMEKLIKTPNEIEAVQILLNEYPRIWAKKEFEFLDKLKKRLETFYKEKNFEFYDYYDVWTHEEEEKEYSNIIEDITAENLSGFILEKKYDSVGYIDLYIEISDGETFLSIGFCDKEKNEISINGDRETICNNLDFKYKNRKYRYKHFEKEIIFYSNKQSSMTYDLFDKNEFNNYISEISEEIEAKINYLVENEKNIIKALSS